MSIILTSTNESLGKSYSKLVKSYLSGKSSIDEYEVGRLMSEDLSKFAKILRCSESNVVYLTEDDLSNKSRELFKYITNSVDKSIKKFKLSDEESVANVYPLDNCLVIVVSTAEGDQLIYYNSKDEGRMME